MRLHQQNGKWHSQLHDHTMRLPSATHPKSCMTSHHAVVHSLVLHHTSHAPGYTICCNNWQRRKSQLLAIPCNIISCHGLSRPGPSHCSFVLHIVAQCCSIRSVHSDTQHCATQCNTLQSITPDSRLVWYANTQDGIA